VPVKIIDGPPKVWVLVYQTKHGDDLYAFSTEERMHEWLAAVAKEGWGEHALFDDVGAPPEDSELLISEYFEHAASWEEYWNADKVVVDQP
jgi:hypothetical protein